jgi:hypothetical protein
LNFVNDPYLPNSRRKKIELLYKNLLAYSQTGITLRWGRCEIKLKGVRIKMKKGYFPILLIVAVFGISFIILIVRDQVFGQQPMPFNKIESSNQQLPIHLQNGQIIDNFHPVIPSNQHRQVIVQPPPSPPKWLVEFTPIDDPTNPSQKIMAITVVDPDSKRILIYHANLSYGALKFISSRDILPDIMLGEYNAVSPTPREIMAEIERLKNNKQ